MYKPYNDVPGISEFLKNASLKLALISRSLHVRRLQQVTPPQSVFLEGSCFLKKHKETVSSPIVEKNFLV